MSDEEFQGEPLEEIVFDLGTGIELERGSESYVSEAIKPWDPALIRVDPKTFSLRQIMDMIKDGDIQIAPDFQRLRVWTQTQKSQLIESILLRIPLPAFYFSSDENGYLQVVDGMQRLSTIYSFYQGEFKLSGLEYLQKSLGGCDFNGLERVDNGVWSRRIKMTQIFAHVIDPQSPVQVKFDIFKRINTGGTPLNSQEIRHCISGNKSREFLKKLTATKEFELATDGKLVNHIRMVDRELALRFCAFYRMESIVDYSKSGSLNNFLTEMTESIDKKMEENELKRLEILFRRSMANASFLFGSYSFRKWSGKNRKVFPINKALFDAWSVNLAFYDLKDIESKKQMIVESARSLFNDEEFIKSISFTTDGLLQIDYRIKTVRNLLRDLIK